MPSISPYPANVSIKPIADGSHVFQAGQFKGSVEKRQNWGTDWLARPEHGVPRFFSTKTQAVFYLLHEEG